MTLASHATDMSHRKTARLFGFLFILTFVTSIAGAALYGPALDDPTAGSDTRIQLGALLEIGLIVANIGTALVIYPLVKRHTPRLALGWVASRIVESVSIGVGLMSMLALVAVRQDGGAADTGHTLLALKDMTFLLGPGFCVGIGNGLMLGYMMYRSGLVPRRMAQLGMLAGTMVLVSSIAVLFGAYEQNGSAPLSVVMNFPEIVWEGFLGIYPLFWGFKAVGARPATATTAAPALAS